MKLKQLLEELEEVKKDLGNAWEHTDVRVFANHGQCDMLANSVDIMYSNSYPDEFMVEDSCTSEEVEHYEEEPTYKFLSISAM